MEINKREMEFILAMYDITTHEGQETDAMIEFVERVRKVKEGSDVI